MTNVNQSHLVKDLSEIFTTLSEGKEGARDQLGNTDATSLCVPCNLLNTWYKRIECLGISLGDPQLSIKLS